MPSVFDPPRGPGAPPAPHNLPCYTTVKAVCASHLQNLSDCENCRFTVPGAWDKIKPACSPYPISNYHESCQSFFPSPPVVAHTGVGQSNVCVMRPCAQCARAPVRPCARAPSLGRGNARRWRVCARSQQPSTALAPWACSRVPSAAQPLSLSPQVRLRVWHDGLVVVRVHVGDALQAALGAARWDGAGPLQQ